MKFAVPLTKELSIERDGFTYKKVVYNPPLSLNGVTDEDYPIYSDDDTYNTGDYVIVPELKTIYRCTADNTKGVFPPASPDIWVDFGFVNSYKMLSTDEQIGAQTIGNNIEMKIEFNRCDTIGLVNTHFGNLLLEEVDEDAGYVTGEDVGTGDGNTKEFYLDNKNVANKSETIYKNGTALTRDEDYTIDYWEGKITFNTAPDDGDEIKADYTKTKIKEIISGRDIGCTSLTEYFYDEIREKTRVIITNLEWLPNATLRLYFNYTSDIKIGSLVIGLLRPLGITLMGTELRFEDRSKIANDEFTDTRKVIRYGHIRVLRGKVLFDNADFNVTAQKISEIIGKNILFVPDEKDKFSEMTNIAYIEEFDMPIENPVKFQTSITLIGVA